VIRVGVYYKTSQGTMFGGQIQGDWEPTATKGNSCLGKFKQMAITFRLQPPTMDEAKKTVRSNKDGAWMFASCMSGFHSVFQIGPGGQWNYADVNAAGKKNNFLDWLFVFTTDETSRKNDKFGGRGLNTMFRLGQDSKPMFLFGHKDLRWHVFNKMFAFSNWRFYPKVKMPDLRLRIFFKPTCSGVPAVSKDRDCLDEADCEKKMKTKEEQLVEEKIGNSTACEDCFDRHKKLPAKYQAEVVQHMLTKYLAAVEAGNFLWTEWFEQGKEKANKMMEADETREKEELYQQKVLENMKETINTQYQNRKKANEVGPTQ